MNNKSLKVLAIGNSFSIDAMEYLWDLANNYGYEDIILGNLYIPGCSVETHWINALDNMPNYQYYRNTKGVWEIKDNVTILDAIKEDQWDVITMQQASGKSGLSNTFQPYLDNLINYVIKHNNNENLKIGWHMTWAYESTHTNPAFKEYDYNQLIMYNSIINNVNKYILTDKRINLIIPSGTAIQNARTSIKEPLTRDGYHLSFGLGRYIAGLMWLRSLTKDINQVITFNPNGLSKEEVMIANKAVTQAYLNPYKITPIK